MQPSRASSQAMPYRTKKGSENEISVEPNASSHRGVDSSHIPPVVGELQHYTPVSADIPVTRTVQRQT